MTLVELITIHAGSGTTSLSVKINYFFHMLISTGRDVICRGGRGPWGFKFFKIVGFLEILMFRWEIFGLFAVGGDQFDIYRKIFELGASYSTGATSIGVKS